MTHRSWTEVVDDPTARHLVVARIMPKATDEPAAVLKALIEGLAPLGDYALLTRCEEEGPITLCAFSHPEDAAALAAAVEAEAIERYSEWASRRAFILDKAMAQGIVDAIEASGAAPEPPQQPAAPLLPAYP